MSMDKELKDAIQIGASLEKIPEKELRRREEQKRKCMEELKTIEKKLQEQA